MTATIQAVDTLLDMPAYVGQAQYTFSFILYDSVTGKDKGTLYPYRDSVPTLTHDTSRTVVRQISGLFFDVTDTTKIDTIRDRLKVYMNIPGRLPYLLGTFVFIDRARSKTTAGLESGATVVDSMFIVDQQIEQSYAAGEFNADGTLISFRFVEQAIGDVMARIPAYYTVEPSPFYSIGSWSAGTGRGSVLKDLSVDGDFFSPWFDNTNVMRFIRSFDPALRVPDFDLDTGYRIDRDSLTYTDNIIDAPNRFIVISNGSYSGQLPVVGTYDVPSSAPHSIANRGFVVPQVTDWQVDYTSQANAIAFNLAQRQMLFEQIEFSTPPDPRHDSYDVLRIGGQNWLEIAWSIQLIAGGTMSHTARRSYI